MRIIDTNHDFYDYLQDSTDTIVFDRRNSFLITKDYLCSNVSSINQFEWNRHKYVHDDFYRFILLQCGATYWLFLMTITEYNSYSIKNFQLELLTTWKNYNKPRVPIKLIEVEFSKNMYISYKSNTYTMIHNNIQTLKNAVDNNDCKVKSNLSYYKNSIPYKNTFKYEIKDIPILNACGIKDFIDPVDIFTAIEEHFSLEKTESERIEPIGATNNDKIVMHGFDTKVSFRGK